MSSKQQGPQSPRKPLVNTLCYKGLTSCSSGKVAHLKKAHVQNCLMFASENLHVLEGLGEGVIVR